MSENDLTFSNPMKPLGFSNDDIIEAGEFGAIMARAGIGKTSLLVQMAVYAMSRGKKVLHISLEEPSKKVNLWYEEVYHTLAQVNKIEDAPTKWDDIVRNRVIMTFKLDGFSVPRLEERLADLAGQDVFSPNTIVIDGFPFEDATRETLTDLKAFAEKMGISVWFTVKTHRHEAPAENGMPVQISSVSDLFSTAIQILPDGEKINIRVIKGETGATTTDPLCIDPETMLING